MKKKFCYILALILTLCVSFTLFGCNEKLQDYNIDVNVWYANYGTVYGKGTYKEQSQVEIKAVPKQNYQFLAWMKDNIVVSYDAVYNFEANKDTAGTYVAIFNCPKLELVTLKNIEFNQEYSATNIVDVHLDVKIGQTFDVQTTVLSTKIENVTDFEITDIVTALNYREKITVTVDLTYTLTTVIDEEETETQISKQTLLEINLTELELTSQVFELNIPESLQDETSKANIQFTFENFTVNKNEQPTEE